MSQTDSGKEKPPPQNVVYDVPAEGSLGLLALGAKGIDLWRQKREQVRLQNEARLKNSAAPDEEK